MEQKKYEIKCPNCGNIIDFNLANFCGACGTDITLEKQKYYQEKQQNQQNYPNYQQQQQQYMQYQQQYYDYYRQQQNMMYMQNIPHINENYKRKPNIFLSILKFICIIGITICLLSLIAVSLVESGFSSKFEGGIDESLFYSYLFSNSDDEEENEYFFAGGISSAEYNKLSQGMSYALASSIIGGDGDLVNTGENLQKKLYYTYRWYSEDTDTIVYYITFVDDEITEIILDYIS